MRLSRFDADSPTGGAQSAWNRKLELELEHLSHRRRLLKVPPLTGRPSSLVSGSKMANNNSFQHRSTFLLCVGTLEMDLADFGPQFEQEIVCKLDGRA